ncbi:MAG: DNA methylase, partial [Bacilli bacterium]|nr:DNA methylase [Bacilli bacterium]
KMVELYERIVNKDLLIRRINIVANNVIDKDKVKDKPQYQQFDLFTNYQELDEKNKIQKKEEQEENKLQNVLLSIKSKYGKNAILKGMNLEEGGTTIDRNGQIGGHKG